MIGIGPVLIIVGVIAIIGTYVTIIHWALQSSEVNEDEGELAANRRQDGAPRSASAQPQPTTAFVPMKT